MVESFNGKLELLAHRLRELIKEKYQVIITLNSATKARRVAEFYRKKGCRLYIVTVSVGEKILLLKQAVWQKVLFLKTLN